MDDSTWCLEGNADFVDAGIPSSEMDYDNWEQEYNEPFSLADCTSLCTSREFKYTGVVSILFISGHPTTALNVIKLNTDFTLLLYVNWLQSITITEACNTLYTNLSLQYFNRVRAGEAYLSCLCGDTLPPDSITLNSPYCPYQDGNSDRWRAYYPPYSTDHPQRIFIVKSKCSWCTTVMSQSPRGHTLTVSVQWYTESHQTTENSRSGFGIGVIAGWT